MPERKLTLFEIHLDDATFTANASATKGVESALPEGEEVDAEAEETDEETGGACPGKGAAKGLLVLVLLVALAAAAKKLTGDELDEELADLADVDEA
jgi:hypothetical protein